MAHLRVKKHSVNHLFYKGLCASEKWNTAWIMYFTRVCVRPSKETQRESRISQGFVCPRVKKHSVNHAFYKVSTTSKYWNRPPITYFTRFRARRSSETRCESRILRSFEDIEALKHAAHHAFYMVLTTSKYWDRPRITHFRTFRGHRSIETRRE